MEMCEALHAMADQEEAIEGTAEKQLVLTILTKEGMSTEEMGFEVEEALPSAQLEVKEYELPFDEPNAQQDQADGHVPQPADMEQEGRLVVGKVLPEKIVVNEVELCGAMCDVTSETVEGSVQLLRSEPVREPEQVLREVGLPHEGEGAEGSGRGCSSSANGGVQAAKSTAFDHGAKSGGAGQTQPHTHRMPLGVSAA